MTRRLAFPRDEVYIKKTSKKELKPPGGFIKGALEPEEPFQRDFSE
jgi:hypothetical protein